MPENNAQRLIEIYNELERYMENKAPNTAYMPFTRRVQEQAMHNPLFREYRDDLFLLVELRNLLVHETFIGEINPVAEPNIKLISRFEAMLSRILAPPMALTEVANLIQSLFSVRWNDKVLPVMKTMNERGYAHAPIIQEGHVEGVFSENSIFSYLSENHGTHLSEDLRIADIAPLVALHRYKRERYQFVGKNASVYDVEEMFTKAISQGSRLAVVFITENGQAKERLLGMITAFSMAGYRA